MASSPTYPPYLFNTPAWSEALGWDHAQYYTTIHCADVTGNGQADILARSATGIVGAYLCKGLGGRLIRLPSGPPLSDRLGYDQPCYYETIQYADVDGDGRTELIVRRSGGIDLFKLNDPPPGQEIPAQSPILPSFMTWSTLATNDPAWSDEASWDEAQYYSTVQAADIDGDGKAELLSRTPGGHIVAYKYFSLKDDPSQGAWRLLQAQDPPYWASDEGWDQAQYYATMQTADIDGDGRAELLARGAGGLIAYKYTPTSELTGTWVHLKTTGAPSWPSSEGWDQPSHYTTIQTADIGGDGRAEVVARGPDGVEVYRYTPSADPTVGSWTQLETLAHWTDESGGDQPANYATIQCADVDGCGRAEILGRNNDGLEVWKYDPSAADGPWVPLASLAHWGNASIGYDDKTQKGGEQYYRTIQCADIDGDGQAEVLGRYDGGIEAFEYDPSTPPKWVPVAPHTTKVPFPQYADEELKAYTYISRKLLPNAVNPSIRNQYNMEGNSPSAWSSTLKLMRRDHGVPIEAWDTVKTQLLLEFSCVSNVTAYFTQANSLITHLTNSREAIVRDVCTSVDITATQKSSSGISATLATMILGIVNAVAIVASDGAGVAAGVFASVMGAALAADPSDNSAVIHAADDLDGWIEARFTNSTAASAYYEQDVLCDWGLLHTLGTLTGGGGPWEKPKEYVTTAVNAAQGSFKLWVYQKLMPVKYPAIISFQPPMQIYGVHDEEENIPSHARLVQQISNILWDFYYVATNINDYAVPTSDCMSEIWSLGATKEEFFFRKNGWDQFKTASQSPP